MRAIFSDIYRVLMVLAVLGFSVPSFSQDLIDQYQFPTSTNWVKIKTENYQIVVPKENENEGQRVANLLQYVYEPVCKTLFAKPKRYTLILSNQNVEANGYVMLSPRKSEWYNNPPQSGLLGTGEWYQLLAVHEGRHMVQYDKFNRGFTRFMSVFLGQYAPSILPNITIPGWFWEGDAVVTETALSNTGRGRIPSFDMPLRTILLSDKNYSYYKSYLGSYKDYTPNNYLLGYHLVSYVRRTFPVNTWSKVTNISAGMSFFPPTFSLALAHYAKKGTVGTYKNAMTDLKEQWTKQLDSIKLSDFKTVKTNRKRCWTNYSFPQYLSDSSIVAQKYGFDHPYQLVKINADGKEKKLLQFMPIDLVRMSPQKNKIVWAETLPDIRWGNRNYASIMSYDLVSGKKKRITRKTRFFAPVLSHDGNRIAAVEFTNERQCAIVIIDAQTGGGIAHLPNPSNDFISTPCWSQNDSFVVFTHQGFVGKALSIQSTVNGILQTLIPYGTEDIGQPMFYNNYVVYNSAYSGIDNIYAINVRNKQRFQLVSAKFGSFNPGFNKAGSKMIFTNYNSLGDEIGLIETDSIQWIPLSAIKDGSIKYYEPIIKQEQGANILVDSLIPKKTYPVEKYAPAGHLLNFHSWQLIPLGPFLNLMAMSNDKLNTTSIVADFNYDLNEMMFGVGFEAAYAGLFPVFEVGAGTHDRSALYLSSNFKDTLTNIWNEKNLSVGAYIPLDLSRGVYYRQLIVGAKMSYLKVNGKIVIQDYNPGDGEFLPLKLYLKFTNAKYGSHRDLYPPFAQIISINNYQTPFKSDYNGQMLSAQGDFYFPGFMKHHSIKISAAYEKQTIQNYTFQSELLFPRGYTFQFFPEFKRMSIDYSMPLFYTHFNIGPFVYIKRFKSTFFYDYGYGNNEIKTDIQEFNSTGLTVTMEFVPFSLPLSLDFGIRTTYLIDQDKISYVPVLGLFF